MICVSFGAAEAFRARLVAVDQHSGADQLGEGPGVLRTVVAAPHQFEHARPLEQVHRIRAGGRRSYLSKRPLVDVLGHAVRDEDAVRQPHRQRTTLQERQERLADLVGRRAVHVLQARAGTAG